MRINFVCRHVYSMNETHTHKMKKTNRVHWIIPIKPFTNSEYVCIWVWMKKRKHNSSHFEMHILNFCSMRWGLQYCPVSCEHRTRLKHFLWHEITFDRSLLPVHLRDNVNRMLPRINHRETVRAKLCASCWVFPIYSIANFAICCNEHKWSKVRVNKINCVNVGILFFDFFAFVVLFFCHQYICDWRCD